MISNEKNFFKTFIENHENEAIEFLKLLVNNESYSNDKNGVDRISHLIKQKLDSEGIECSIIENENYGSHLVARIKGNKNGKVIMVGHQDTAHPTGTINKFPTEMEGGKLIGPGVSDMKSGLVYMIYIMIAFKKLKPETMYDLELLLTPDEEIGSPISKELIQNRAKHSKAAFVLEPARPDGTIVTSRKGSAHLKLEIEGKSAHSGAFIEQGISANDELANKMIEIKKLMDEKKGLTVNFGIIKGGVSNNIVSPYAEASIHCAFWKVEDFNQLYSSIQKIVDTEFVANTKSKLTGEIGMLPMENNGRNNELYEKVVLDAAADLNLEVVGMPTKGASEAGFISFEEVPTICGMGPVGGHWHTLNEYLDMESFKPRFNLLGLSVYKCMTYY